MAVDTFIAYVGVYDNASDADADYDLVKDLHTKAGLIDSYDAAVVERRRMNGRLSTGDGVPGRKRSTTSAAVSRARIAGCSSRSTIRNPPSVLDAPSC